MTKKERVIEFLLNNPSLNNTKNGWDEFSNQNPDIIKSSYTFYRNQAIKDGTVPTPEVQVSRTGYVEQNVDVTTLPDYKEFEVVKIDLENIDMSKFTAKPTGTAFDMVASKRNGVMPSTVYMITGESGAGKTTISTNIANYLKENNEDYTAGFISGEMDKYDWTEECIDNPDLAELETVFLLDYIDAPNYLEVLTKALTQWNFVVLDSFEVVLDQIKELKGWTGKKAEAYLITLLRKASSESGCTILVIQQFTKGGTYVGSTKIKHLLTGMMIVRFDKEGGRYLEFTKNRRCGHMVGKRLYYTKDKETGKLVFDQARLETSLETDKISETEQEQLTNDSDVFEQEVMKRAKELAEKREKISRNLEQRANVLDEIENVEFEELD